MPGGRGRGGRRRGAPAGGGGGGWGAGGRTGSLARADLPFLGGCAQRSHCRGSRRPAPPRPSPRPPAPVPQPSCPETGSALRRRRAGLLLPLNPSRSMGSPAGKRPPCPSGPGPLASLAGVPRQPSGPQGGASPTGPGWQLCSVTSHPASLGKSLDAWESHLVFKMQKMLPASQGHGED